MYRNLSLSFFFLLLLSSLTTYGQTAETVRTSRPGQAIEPFTVGRGVGQIQAGFAHSWYNYESSAIYNWNGYDAVLRYGLLEHFELSALLNYGTYGISSLNPVSGLDACHIGMKYSIFSRDRGLIQSVGVQYRLKLRAVSEDFRTDGTGSKMTISAQSPLTNRLTLVANTGLDWNGSDPEATWFYVLNLSCSVGERWGVFIENYGDRVRSSGNTYFDGGVSFLANPNLQLDLSIGAADLGLVNQYFLSTGLSWRFGAGT